MTSASSVTLAYSESFALPMASTSVLSLPSCGLLCPWEMQLPRGLALLLMAIQLLPCPAYTALLTSEG